MVNPRLQIGGGPRGGIGAGDEPSDFADDVGLHRERGDVLTPRLKRPARAMIQNSRDLRTEKDGRTALYFAKRHLGYMHYDPADQKPLAKFNPKPKAKV